MPDNVEVTPQNAPSTLGGDVPQFATAEYGHIPGTERCRICGNLISGEYYRVNNQMACGTCAQQARAGQPVDSHSAFVRGLLLGCGAALLGMILYATFTIVTNLYIGYVALAVGWFVAKAITKGSGGIGGRRYQVAAVLLTYAAISVAAIPIWVSSYSKEKKQAAAQHQNANPSSDDANANSATQPEPQSPPTMSFSKAIVGLFFVGLASPFLQLRDPVHGLIGLVILFVGLRIAWQLTRARPLQVDGPFSVTAG